MPRTIPFIIALSSIEERILIENSRKYTASYAKRWCEPRSCFLRLPGWPTSKSPNSWTCRSGSSRSGASVSITNDWRVWRTNPGAADRALFPPQSIVEIKALACELPRTLGLPFSRLSSTDIVREAVVRGIVVSISITTVWRWLDGDAIKPWTHHSWLLPRDPLFAEKAALTGSQQNV